MTDKKNDTKHKSKVYTKTGDQGTSSLLGGERVAKHHLRLVAYGELDELNSHIGFLITLLDRASFLNNIEHLEKIQHQIFNLGSYFACENEQVAERFKIIGVNHSHIEILEHKMDEWDEQLMPLKNFILPGGEKASAYAHICRTVCRRVERTLTELYQSENKLIGNKNDQIKFINRLSDYFFVLSRWINFKHGTPEVLWQKES